MSSTKARPTVYQRKTRSLLYAVHYGDVPRVQRLLHELQPISPDLIDEAGITFERNKGASLLFMATRNNRLELMDIFIRQGANVNLGKMLEGRPPNSSAKKANGPKALGVVAQEGHVDALIALIACGANANAFWRHPALASPFVDQATYAACNSGHLDCLAVLLAAGASPGRRVEPEEEEGGANLICLPPISAIASFSAHLDMLSMLMSNGADTHSPDENGYSPLDQSSLNHHTDISIALLASYGADVHQMDGSGRTALHSAAQEGDAGLIAMLAYAAGDGAVSFLNLVDNQGISALRLASGTGLCSRVVRFWGKT